MDRVHLGLGLAALALVLGAASLLRGLGGAECTCSQAAQPAASIAIATASPSATHAPEVDARVLQALADRLTAHERRIAELEARPSDDDDDAAPSGSASPRSGPARLANGSPRVVRFDVGETAIDVTQGDDGSLSVKNRDPALTGTTVVVRGYSESGEETEFAVTVPPP